MSRFVARDELGPLVVGHLQKRHTRKDPGVVDQDVDATERVASIEHGLAVVTTPHVTLDRHRLRPCRGNRCRHFLSTNPIVENEYRRSKDGWADSTTPDFEVLWNRKSFIDENRTSPASLLELGLIQDPMQKTLTLMSAPARGG